MSCVALPPTAAEKKELQYDICSCGRSVFLHIEQQSKPFTKWLKTANFIHNGVAVRSVSPAIRKGAVYLQGSEDEDFTASMLFESTTEARAFVSNAKEAIDCALLTYSTTPQENVKELTSEQKEQIVHDYQPAAPLQYAKDVLDKLPPADLHSLLTQYQRKEESAMFTSKESTFRQLAPLLAKLFEKRPVYKAETFLTEDNSLCFRLDLNANSALAELLGYTRLAERDFSESPVTLTLYPCK